jgi:hypothetical protein
MMKGATRRVAAMAGEAIPVVGATITWGLTALDLNDACEAMKDLNALDIATGDGQLADASTVCGLQFPTLGEVDTWIGQGWKDAYKRAADALDKDGNANVPADVAEPTESQARSTYCSIVGC